MSKRAATDETDIPKKMIRIQNPLPCEIGNMIFENFKLQDLIPLTENVLEKAYNPDIHTHEYAIRNNELQMLKWLLKNKNVEPTDDLIDLAAECGNLDIFKYVEETLNKVKLRRRITTKGICKAIENGHLDIIQHIITQNHIRKKDFNIDYTPVCTFAARCNQRAIIEWMITQYQRHIDIFKVMKEASSSRHCHIVHWILDTCTKTEIMGK